MRPRAPNRRCTCVVVLPIHCAHHYRDTLACCEVAAQGVDGLAGTLDAEHARSRSGTCCAPRFTGYVRTVSIAAFRERPGRPFTPTSPMPRARPSCCPPSRGHQRTASADSSGAAHSCLRPRASYTISWASAAFGWPPRSLDLWLRDCDPRPMPPTQYRRGVMATPSQNRSKHCA